MLIRKLITSLAIYALILPACLSAEFIPSEYQTKAVLLYNIINFTRWPDNTFSADSEPYNICILGDDPYSEIFAQMTDWKAKGRSLKARQISIEADDITLKTCQVLMIRLKKQFDLKRFIEKSQALSILSISEIIDDSQPIAMINFAIEQRKIKFSVNRGAANNAEIDFSSQMLRLASQVIN